jgi:hypothetical protein
MDWFEILVDCKGKKKAWKRVGKFIVKCALLTKHKRPSVLDQLQ